MAKNVLRGYHPWFHLWNYDLRGCDSYQGDIGTPAGSAIDGMSFWHYDGFNNYNIICWPGSRVGSFISQNNLYPNQRTFIQTQGSFPYRFNYGNQQFLATDPRLTSDGEDLCPPASLAFSVIDNEGRAYITAPEEWYNWSTSGKSAIIPYTTVFKNPDSWPSISDKKWKKIVFSSGMWLGLTENGELWAVNNAIKQTDTIHRIDPSSREFWQSGASWAYRNHQKNRLVANLSNQYPYFVGRNASLSGITSYGGGTYGLGNHSFKVFHQSASTNIQFNNFIDTYEPYKIANYYDNQLVIGQASSSLGQIAQTYNTLVNLLRANGAVVQDNPNSQFLWNDAATYDAICKYLGYEKVVAHSNKALIRRQILRGGFSYSSSSCTRNFSYFTRFDPNTNRFYPWKSGTGGACHLTMLVLDGKYEKYKDIYVNHDIKGNPSFYAVGENDKVYVWGSTGGDGSNVSQSNHRLGRYKNSQKFNASSSLFGPTLDGPVESNLGAGKGLRDIGMTLDGGVCWGVNNDNHLVLWSSNTDGNNVVYQDIPIKRLVHWETNLGGPKSTNNNKNEFNGFIILGQNNAIHVIDSVFNTIRKIQQSDLPGGLSDNANEVDGYITTLNTDFATWKVGSISKTPFIGNPKVQGGTIQTWTDIFNSSSLFSENFENNGAIVDVLESTGRLFKFYNIRFDNNILKFDFEQLYQKYSNNATFFPGYDFRFDGALSRQHLMGFRKSAGNDNSSNLIIPPAIIRTNEQTILTTPQPSPFATPPATPPVTPTPTSSSFMVEQTAYIKAFISANFCNNNQIPENAVQISIYRDIRDIIPVDSEQSRSILMKSAGTPWVWEELIRLIDPALPLTTNIFLKDSNNIAYKLAREITKGGFSVAKVIDNSICLSIQNFVTPTPTRTPTQSPAPSNNRFYGGVVREYEIGGKKYISHTFTSSGNFTINSLNPSTKFDILVVGGGGGGGQLGRKGAGGGGAGGLVYLTNNQDFFTTGNYNINVGNGGVASNNGQNSSIVLQSDISKNITATGGGRGGNGEGLGAQGGASGGSGGGGGFKRANSGGAGISGQGFAGGTASTANYVAGGGGGGAAGRGGNTVRNPQNGFQRGGPGGPGRLINIDGSGKYYAGGGAGHGQHGQNVGGIGGGGNTGAIGQPNTGGGGGANARGGSGIVIIQYEYLPDVLVSPTPTATSTSTGTPNATTTQTPPITATRTPTRTPAETPTRTPTQTETPTPSPTDAIQGSHYRLGLYQEQVCYSDPSYSQDVESPYTIVAYNNTETRGEFSGGDAIIKKDYSSAIPPDASYYWYYNDFARIFGLPSLSNASIQLALSRREIYPYNTIGTPIYIRRNPKNLSENPTVAEIRFNIGRDMPLGVARISSLPLLCPTPTPTSSQTTTPTITATQTSTPPVTPTPSHTPTQTRTPTLTPTQSLTRTATRTPSVTPTQTKTASNTPTQTQTPTPSVSDAIAGAYYYVSLNQNDVCYLTDSFSPNTRPLSFDEEIYEDVVTSFTDNTFGSAQWVSNNDSIVNNYSTSNKIQLNVNNDSNDSFKVYSPIILDKYFISINIDNLSFNYDSTNSQYNLIDLNVIDNPNVVFMARVINRENNNRAIQIYRYFSNEVINIFGLEENSGWQSVVSNYTTFDLPSDADPKNFRAYLIGNTVSVYWDYVKVLEYDLSEYRNIIDYYVSRPSVLFYGVNTDSEIKSDLPKITAIDDGQIETTINSVNNYIYINGKKLSYTAVSFPTYRNIANISVPLHKWNFNGVLETNGDAYTPTEVNNIAIWRYIGGGQIAIWLCDSNWNRIRNLKTLASNTQGFTELEAYTKLDFNPTLPSGIRAILAYNDKDDNFAFGINEILRRYDYTPPAASSNYWPFQNIASLIGADIETPIYIRKRPSSYDDNPQIGILSYNEDPSLGEVGASIISSISDQCPTPTPSPTQTITPTRTSTQTPTQTQTQTQTPSFTPTPSITPSHTATPTVSVSETTLDKKQLFFWGQNVQPYDKTFPDSTISNINGVKFGVDDNNYLYINDKPVTDARGRTQIRYDQYYLYIPVAAAIIPSVDWKWTVPNYDVQDNNNIIVWHYYPGVADGLHLWLVNETESEWRFVRSIGTFYPYSGADLDETYIAIENYLNIDLNQDNSPYGAEGSTIFDIAPYDSKETTFGGFTANYQLIQQDNNVYKLSKISSDRINYTYGYLQKNIQDKNIIVETDLVSIKPQGRNAYNFIDMYGVYMNVFDQGVYSKLYQIFVRLIVYADNRPSILQLYRYDSSLPYDATVRPIINDRYKILASYTGTLDLPLDNKKNFKLEIFNNEIIVTYDNNELINLSLADLTPTVLSNGQEYIENIPQGSNDYARIAVYLVPNTTNETDIILSNPSILGLTDEREPKVSRYTIVEKPIQPHVDSELSRIKWKKILPLNIAENISFTFAITDDAIYGWGGSYTEDMTDYYDLGKYPILLKNIEDFRALIVSDPSEEIDVDIEQPTKILDIDYTYKSFNEYQLNILTDTCSFTLKIGNNSESLGPLASIESILSTQVEIEDVINGEENINNPITSYQKWNNLPRIITYINANKTENDYYGASNKFDNISFPGDIGNITKIKQPYYNGIILTRDNEQNIIRPILGMVNASDFNIAPPGVCRDYYLTIDYDRSTYHEILTAANGAYIDKFNIPIIRDGLSSTVDIEALRNCDLLYYYKSNNDTEYRILTYDEILTENSDALYSTPIPKTVLFFAGFNTDRGVYLQYKDFAHDNYVEYNQIYGDCINYPNYLSIEGSRHLGVIPLEFFSIYQSPDPNNHYSLDIYKQNLIDWQDGQKKILDEEKFNNFVVSAKAGSNFSIMRTINGDVYSWGNNSEGQLGLEDNVDRLTPTKIANIQFKSIDIFKGNFNDNIVYGLDIYGIPYYWGTNISNFPVLLNNNNSYKNYSFAGRSFHPTPTPTASITPSVTVTASTTPTNTSTQTNTPSITSSCTTTPTTTPTNTPTSSITPSNTVTPSITASNTPSVTPTHTPTPSFTPISAGNHYYISTEIDDIRYERSRIAVGIENTSLADGSLIYRDIESSTPWNFVDLVNFFASPTPTPSFTPTRSQTPTNTPTNTVTPSVTATNTCTPTLTATATVTPSYTETTTATATNTATPTNTPTNTGTPTTTPTYTPTFTQTPSYTTTNTSTPTNTPTNTRTSTATATTTLTPSQGAGLVFTITGDSFVLPLIPEAFGGVYDFQIYWGDGSYSNIQSFEDSEKQHTYSTSGTYTISIRGTIKGWSFWSGDAWFSIGNNEALSLGSTLTANKRKIKDIIHWGPLEFVDDITGIFRDCTNLNVLASGSPVIGNSLIHAFSSCTSLVGSTMSDLDIRNVNDMSSCFAGATQFNADISLWNTSNVSAIDSMFMFASSFSQDIGSWNIGRIISANNFMLGIDIGTNNYDNILKGWLLSAGQSSYGLNIHFGSSKFTTGSASDAARTALQASPYNWIISDGGGTT